jgi:O-antigen/teichoic acid export membrane protein
VAHLWQIGWYNLRAGWSILLATVVTILALSLDRIAVSLSFGIRDFAVYSLAATALAVLNTIMLSVSRVVFPYLSGEGLSPQLKLRAYTWGESCLVTLWAISLAGYFPLRSLIGWYLPAYGRSLPILRLLMLATGLTAVIYILHANYFRSGLRQGRLLAGACVGLFSAALFLALARRTGSLPNMAWAMVAAIGVWWGADEMLLRELIKKTALETGKTLIFTLACGGSFLLCATNLNPGRGFVWYACIATLLVTLVYGRALRSLPLTKLFAPWSAGSGPVATRGDCL